MKLRLGYRTLKYASPAYTAAATASHHHTKDFGVQVPYSTSRISRVYFEAYGVIKECV